MKIRKLRSIKAAAFFCALMVFAFACEKPEKGIGEDLLPEGDALNTFYTDTISVIAYNKNIIDSVRTGPTNIGLLGSYWDPMMGKHRSEVYFELRLPSSNVNFGGDTAVLVMDSVVLALDYVENYTGRLNPLSIQVFEITEKLELDSAYYSNQTIETDIVDLVDPAFNFVLPDPDNTQGIAVGEDSLAAHMRIRLKNEFGERFLDPLVTDSLATADVFREWFNGLHVRSGDENSAIVGLDLINAESKMTLYYHIQEPDTNIAREFSFLINSNGQRFNHFEHDFSGSLVDYYLNDSTLGQQRLFIQAAASQTIFLDIPFLENWKDSVNLAVNQAMLIFPFEDTKNDLKQPSRIFAVRYDEDGEEQSTPDQFQGDVHLDGFLDLEDREYRINITRYVQQVLTGELDDRGLRIRPSFNGTNFNRVSLYRFENPERNAKLEFTYTRY